MNALYLTSIDHIPQNKKKQHSVVPGWNDYVKEAHSQARRTFLLWASMGKPKQGDVYHNMLRERAYFKYSLRDCKKQEAITKADKLAGDLLNKDQIQFWRDVKSQSCKNVPLADIVDNKHGQKNITVMWAEHFKLLFSSVKNTTFKAGVLAKTSDISMNDFSALAL